MPRLVPLVLLAAVLAGCGSSAAKISAPPTPKRTFAGGEVSPPRTAPPIRLHDAAGRRVTLAAQRGRYVLVTFLYTHCPDVCPLIAQNLNAAVKSFGGAANGVRVLAVSVDPKGDTPGGGARLREANAPRAAVSLPDRHAGRAAPRLGGLARAERSAVGAGSSTTSPTPRWSTARARNASSTERMFTRKTWCTTCES